MQLRVESRRQRRVGGGIVGGGAQSHVLGCHVGKRIERCGPSIYLGGERGLHALLLSIVTTYEHLLDVSALHNHHQTILHHLALNGVGIVPRHRPIGTRRNALARRRDIEAYAHHLAFGSWLHLGVGRASTEHKSREEE